MSFYDAIQALLPSTVVSFQFTSDLSSPPTVSDYPHVVIGGTPESEYSGAGLDRPSLSNEADAARLDLMFTYAALNATSLAIVMRNTRQALLRARPQVAGYRCELSRLTSLQNITTDRDVSVGSMHPMFAIDEARLTAHKLTGGS